MKGRFLFLAVLMIFSGVAVSGGGKIRFPITEDVPHIWEWPVVAEGEPENALSGFFLQRYHRSPEGQEKLGPYGLTISLREAPEVGPVYQAWRIVRDDDGSFDLSGAHYSFRSDDKKWFVVEVPVPVRRIALGPTDVAVVDRYTERHTTRILSTAKPSAKGRSKLTVKNYVEVHRTRYSSYTLQEVTVILQDPHDITNVDWISFKIKNPKVIEKGEKVK